MKEFYVVLVTIVLFNCISLSRITGHGFPPRRPGGRSERPGGWLKGDGFTLPDNPSVTSLFATTTAALLFANTLLVLGGVSIAGYVSEVRPAPWMIIVMSAVSAGLLLLPLTTWLRYRFVLSARRLRILMPIAAFEVMLLTSLLLLASPQPGIREILLWVLVAGAGSVVMLTAFASLRLRLSVSDAPGIWQGLPLELMTAGILALVLFSPARAIT